MKYFLSLIIIIGVCMFSCAERFPAGTPTCVQSLMADFIESPSCPEAKINMYVYNNAFYYSLEKASCCCDQQNFYYDANCTLVCTTGGIAGDANVCTIPVDSLVFVKTIWQGE